MKLLLLLIWVFCYPYQINTNLVSEVTENEAMLITLMVYDVPYEVGTLLWDVGEENGYDFSLLLAQAFVESSYNHEAVSVVNAYGLMQIMLGANDHMNIWYDTDYDRFVPEDNVRIGVNYMLFLKSHYGYSTYQALRHYNGGHKWREKNSTHNYAIKIIRLAGEMEKVLAFNVHSILYEKEMLALESENMVEALSFDDFMLPIFVILVLLCALFLSTERTESTYVEMEDNVYDTIIGSVSFLELEHGIVVGNIIIGVEDETFDSTVLLNGYRE